MGYHLKRMVIWHSKDCQKEGIKNYGEHNKIEIVICDTFFATYKELIEYKKKIKEALNIKNIDFRYVDKTKQEKVPEWSDDTCCI